MGRLSGKTAVITGAGSGIGRAASLLFAAEGAKLVIADKTDGAVETARLVAEAGGKALALTGDAGDEAFVESLVKTATAEFGGLDVAWANAGIEAFVANAVGTGIKPRNLVVARIPRSQDQYWQTTSARSQILEYRQPVALGQTQIQDASVVGMVE